MPHLTVLNANPASLVNRRWLIGNILVGGSVVLLEACGGSAALTTSASNSGAQTIARSATITSPAAPAATSSSVVTSSRSPVTSNASRAVASASNSAARSSVSVVFWGLGGTQPPGPTADQLIAEFNQAHPDVHASLVNKPQIGTATADQLTAAIAGGSGPDLVYLGISLIQDYAAAQALVPLDQYVSRPAFNVADYYPQFLDPPRWHGKLYGVPYVPDDRGLYWNKDLFRAVGLNQPPQTWAELHSATSALTKHAPDGQLQQLGYVPGWGNPPTFLGWQLRLWQLGGDILTPDHRKPAYNTPLGVQALQTMIDQMKAAGGYAAVQQFASRTKPPTGLDLFSSGHLAMFDNGVWAIKNYDLINSLNYAVAPFPLPPPGNHVNMSGCPYLSVTQGSKHHDQAWQLIEYLESPEPLRRFNTADTTLPPRKSVATSSAFLSSKARLKYFVDELADTRLLLSIPGSVDIFKVHAQMYADTISGKVSAADAIARSVPQVQAILDRNAAVL